MFPIAKIIKVGSQMVDYHGTPIKTAPYKAGDIVALPPAKVMGERPNPMYEHWLRTSASLGVDVQTDPPPTIITNIDENYAEYQWTRLGNIEPDEQDQKTYLLSSYEVRGHFDMDKFLTK